MQRLTELVPIPWCGVKASEGFGKLRKVAAFWKDLRFSDSYDFLIMNNLLIFRLLSCLHCWLLVVVSGWRLRIAISVV